MRLLLDESLPKPFGRLLVGHDVDTVIDAGWSGLTNSKLLEAAQHRFDCLLTADQSLAYQQNLPRFAKAGDRLDVGEGAAGVPGGEGSYDPRETVELESCSRASCRRASWGWSPNGPRSTGSSCVATGRCWQPRVRSSR